MDLSRLSIGDKLSTIGAIAVVIAGFFPWYSWSSGDILGIAGAKVSYNLWDASGFMAFLILLGALVGIALILLRMFDVFDLSEQGVPEALVILIAAAVAGVFTLIRVASIPGGAGIIGVGRSWGLWLGLVAVAVYIAGALMKFQGERA